MPSRFLQVGADNVVDFTGTTKTDSTKMSLRAAPVAGENRVVIRPPNWNGQCVADTPGTALTLEPCVPGSESQTWRIVLAGDSGQFELEGRYGIVHVLEGLITADESGRTGLQTLPFTG